MSWVASIVVSLLTGVAGLFLAGFIANACVSWYHISSREGASGYFVIFLAGAGGVAGVIIGLITARIIAAQSGAGFGKEFGGALGVVLIIAGVAALLCRFLADVPPKLEGRPLILEVEFRFPNSADVTKQPTTDGEWKFTLGSLAGHTRRAYESGMVKAEGARVEQGRWIVPTEVSLFTERGKRVVSLQKDEQDMGGFLVPLPRRPGKEFEQWSDWLPRQGPGGAAWPADKMSYRFRVQKEPLPPPPQTDAEFMAENAAKEAAEFAAIPTDGPVQNWFPYLHKKELAERAWQNIANRPDLAGELGALALGEDADLAGAALRLIEQMPKANATFVAPVTKAGSDIAARIQKFNTTSVEADPHLMGAADVSIRFHGWMEAVRALRKDCGGDFVPELNTILELSRVRTDSHAMRSDVCRVASFYMNEWAGVAPLPTDPKPR